MADEGEGADSVLARIQGQSDVFEAGVDRTDAKVNDGNNYAGLMNPKDYKAKRAELAKDDETIKKEKDDAIRAKILAQRAEKDKDLREREGREQARKEKLRRELAGAAEGEGEEAEAAAKKKKKKKGGGAPTLSFDVED
jgi:hypothetical protein